MNVFFLLTFPLAALTAFLVMRRLGISAGAALVCASLYALLPYHFLRGETHLFLSAYYSVPLAAYLILAVLSGEPLFARRGGTRAWLLALASRRTLTTLTICVVVASASGSFYYAGFAVLLLGAAALFRFVSSAGHASSRPAVPPWRRSSPSRRSTQRPRSRITTRTAAIQRSHSVSPSRASTTVSGSPS